MVHIAIPKLIKVAELMSYDSGVGDEGKDKAIQVVQQEFLPNQLTEAETWLAGLPEEDLSAVACGEDLSDGVALPDGIGSRFRSESSPEDSIDIPLHVHLVLDKMFDAICDTPM